jgi:hypothetical protein
MRALSVYLTYRLTNTIGNLNIGRVLLYVLLTSLLLMLSISAPRAQDKQSTIELSGKATFRWFGIKVYDIALYLDKEERSFDLRTTRPLTLKITYDMNIDAVDLIENTSEQWQEIGLGQSKICANKAQWLDKLQSIWPNISSGDSLTLTIDLQQISTFYHNEVEKGQIEDANFGYCFAAIWLAKDTTEPKIRRKLLKGVRK